MAKCTRLYCTGSKSNFSRRGCAGRASFESLKFFWLKLFIMAEYNSSGTEMPKQDLALEDLDVD